MRDATFKIIYKIFLLIVSDIILVTFVQSHMFLSIVAIDIKAWMF